MFKRLYHQKQVTGFRVFANSFITLGIVLEPNNFPFAQRMLFILAYKTPDALHTIHLVDFVKTASEADRTALAESSNLSHQTRVNYYRINRQLRNLQPTNNHQEELRAQMLADWDTVSEFHGRLRTIAEYEAPGFFWIVIIAGFLAVVIPFYIYSPKIANLVILSTYAAFNGFVMYVIFSIANPFTGPLAIDSTILENLLAAMVSASP